MTGGPGSAGSTRAPARKAAPDGRRLLFASAAAAAAAAAAAEAAVHEPDAEKNSGCTAGSCAGAAGAGAAPCFAGSHVRELFLWV